MADHLLTISPRFVVQNDEELSRCKAAFALLNSHITVFLLISDEDEEDTNDELTPWERYERGEDDEFGGPPDETVCTIREYSCERHGTTYSVRMHAPWPFRFLKPVEDLIIGPGGCKFKIKNTQFHILLPMPDDE